MQNMKEIKAYIRKDCLDTSVNELAKIEGLSGLSVSTVTGFGRSRGVLRFVNFETHNKLEIVCANALAGKVVEIIRRSACTGHRGDGKIYVSDVVESIRIESGIRNES